MAQAVTEPGPMKAAEITDQNRTLPRPERKERDLGIADYSRFVGFWKGLRSVMIFSISATVRGAASDNT